MMTYLRTAGQAYAAIYFSQNSRMGALLLLASLLWPNTGLSGLIGLGSALLISRALHIAPAQQGSHLYNGLLVGLSLGAVYPVSPGTILLMVAGCLVAVLIGLLSNDLLWQREKLIAFSLPFALTTLLISPAAQHQMLLPNTSTDPIFARLIPALPSWLQPLSDYLSSLGGAYFIESPWMGLLITLSLLRASRYLSLMALAGYLTGRLTYLELAGGSHPELIPAFAFNFILTTMALSMWTIPGRASALLALSGAALNALMVNTLQSLGSDSSIPWTSLPFLVTTLTILAALQRRSKNCGPELNLHQPDLPERSYERARLARSRGALAGIPQLLPPFQGNWQVYQGCHGPHTHQPPWQYALDFYQTEDDCSFRTDGRVLEDYRCFNEAVHAPVSGQIISWVNHLPDNAPGQVDSVHLWGNHLMIRTLDGYYVVLAHLKQFSIEVQSGAWVEATQFLARCGNSGRSPQPHLHLHVQRSAEAGAATWPFRLCHGLCTSPTMDQTETGYAYQLSWLPKEGDSLQPSRSSPALAEAMSLPLGRVFEYRCQRALKSRLLRLSIVIDLQGERRIQSDSGASCAFVQTPQLLACYDRKGPQDPWFDAWILAIGLSPMDVQPIRWHDHPSADLLRGFRHRVGTLLRHPLPQGLHSCYHRQPEHNREGWHQTGIHQFSFLGVTTTLHTEARIVPATGLSQLQILLADSLWGEAELIAITQLPDAGIPGWRRPISVCSWSAPNTATFQQVQETPL